MHGESLRCTRTCRQLMLLLAGLLLSVFLPNGSMAWSATYSTAFPGTENPLSENGNWLNGKAVGLDWQNIRTTPGFAFFAQPNPNSYDDATAVLAGSWGPDQYVRTKVRIPTPDPQYVQEIEIRLRSTMSAHSCTGYEVLGASQIVRWNGPLGNFTVLQDEGPHGVLHDGDLFEASIVGNVITVYINGVKKNRAVDGTFSNGSPGIGLFTRNPSAAAFGFAYFAASNSPISNQPPQIVTAPSANPNPVTLPNTATINVIASDPDNGPAALSYTWSVVTKPTGAANPTFSPNGSASARSSIAAFSAPGSYLLRVTVSDSLDGVTSDVTVTVNPRLSRPGKDFSGDGRADILLRHPSSGAVHLWLMK